jgi:hypothetical protein
MRYYLSIGLTSFNLFCMGWLGCRLACGRHWWWLAIEVVGLGLVIGWTWPHDRADQADREESK